MRRHLARSGLIGLLVTALAACGPSSSTIPAGAHVVHVTVAGAEVRLMPSTVPAGDIYFVMDTPRSSVGIVGAQRTAEATPGPLTEKDIERLAHGDTEGTWGGGFDLIGCSDEQRVEGLGQIGYCGNVFRMPLGAGKYALYTGELEGWLPGDAARSMAVLEVLP